MPDDALGQERFEREHALAVGLEQALHGHVGELGHHLGNALRSHFARRAPPGARAGEIEDREGLVGKHATRQVAHRPGDGSCERVVGVRAPVVPGEPFGDSIEDSARHVLIGLFDFDQRESPTEAGSDSNARRYSSGVVVPMQGSSPRAKASLSSLATSSTLSPPKREWILVEEQHHAAHGLANFVANRRNALRQGAAHVGSGDELGDRNLDDDAVVERRDLVACGDALGDAGHDRSFADARGPTKMGLLAWRLARMSSA